MSERTRRVGRIGARLPAVGTARALAFAAAAIVSLSYVTVLYRVTNVVGTNERFVVVAVGVVLAGIVCGRLFNTAVALVLGLGVVVLGTIWYFQSVPDGVRLLVSVGQFAADAVALMTGLSILRVLNAGVWAIAFVPAPTFFLWYFTVRRRYVLAGLCGGAALSLFVLTGDAGAPLTLLGVVGVAGLVGFGDVDSRDGDIRRVEAVSLVLAAMIVVSLLVSIVPGGAANPVLPGPSNGDSIEASLVNTDDQVSVAGSVSLSPAVRFHVRTNEPNYWRVGAYDRYTGTDWYRTGGTRTYNGTLSEPPGDTREVEQTFRAATELNVMPAAWRPTTVGGTLANRTRVTSTGALRPNGALPAGTNYTVTSEVPDATAADLRAASEDYPGGLRARYTQLPDGTPERLGTFTTRLTANANGSYQTARVIERWLETNKNYSLDVDRPDGDIASGFVFEMNAGYCVYYATAMTAMLRTQGIPARFAVGYTPGEQRNGQRVVRGLDSHAWVEVYFPDQGWIRFDPTPSDPRTNAERQAIDDAQAAGTPSGATTRTPTETPDAGSSATDAPGEPPSTAEPETQAVAGGDPGGDAGLAGDNGGRTPTGATGIQQGSGPAGGVEQTGTTETSDSGGLPPIPIPTREQLLLGVIVLGGVVAGVHRSEIAKRAYRTVWLRRQRSHEPVADAERAFARLEYLLAREHRERRPGETPRAYLQAIGADERARRVGGIYERARYGEHVSERDASEAIATVDELVSELSRFG